MISESTTIIIVGATGDLARRKLLSALFNLYCKGRLPARIKIIGFSRTDLSDVEYRDLMWDGIQEFADPGLRSDEWGNFSECLHYVTGSASSLGAFAGLKRRVDSLERDVAVRNRLFYLATAPQLFEPAVKNLGDSGLATDGDGWRRVVIEKPFGRDLNSAQALNRSVHQTFDESQVYRIDHYLGKETVQNLMVLRFANAIFEPLWNRNYIDSVQITVAEQLGVEDRAGYYDQSGVIRDMLQNHLLQLMTLVAMEPPNAMDAESLRDKKVEVLKGIRRWSPEEAVHHAVRGQYQGYLQEKDVPADSLTATYAGMRLYLDNWRWDGVPFYLRTGKAMAEIVSEIIIKFRDPPRLMFSSDECQDFSSNILALCLQPDEGMHLRFQAKVPDENTCMQPVDMEFHYGQTFKDKVIPDAYERLLQDALEGDSRLFIRSDHIEEAWRVVGPLMDAWNDTSMAPLHLYEPGTWGPEAADVLVSEDGGTWLRGCGSH